MLINFRETNTCSAGKEFLSCANNLFLAYTQAINLDVGPKTCSNCLLLLTFLVCLQGSAFQPQQCKDLPPKKGLGSHHVGIF